MSVGLGLVFLCRYLCLAYCVFFLVYLRLLYLVLVLFAFTALHFVSSVLRQDTGREERLRNDLLCVEWGVKR